MKHLIYHSLAAFMLLAVVPVSAQDTYDAANISREDLNGTARYVGMGGAMDALGADLSTISTNPAGIGLFRRSMASISFGFVSQDGVDNFAGCNKTNMSFDQAGFVYSSRTGINSYLNFAFNYHKSNNFDQILNVANTLNGSSQANQTMIKGMSYKYANGNYSYSFLDDFYADYVYDKSADVFTSYSASKFALDRAQTGYVGVYDFNFSGNIKDRLYLGLTVGVHDVHYSAYTEYWEDGYRLFKDDRTISGTGADIKVGAILRPVDESPFRIGVSVSTPTWYTLTTSNSIRFDDGTTDGDSYKFKLYTPWRFGLSVGHTVGNYLALGASYEYADYSSCDNRIIDNDGWNPHEWDGENSHTDHEMKRHTEKALSGVSTLKLGAELKPDKNLAIRLGYNYVSPQYKSDAVRDQMMTSGGVAYASTTDYTNWKGTNRLTVGAGYTFDQFRVDLAYQYSTTKGDFYPFMKNVNVSYSDNNGDQHSYTNSCEATSVKNDRHQLLLTLGYTF